MATLIHSIDDLPASAAANGIVFVPTMGGLHAGHLSLVRRARQLVDAGKGGCVVVSIFVNPLQFSPAEDFSTYPRDLDGDVAKLQTLADWVYAPPAAELYPTPQQVGIALPPLARDLCGAARPHFFGGVAVVVAKLFNLIRPRIAVFGQKDYQQAYLVRQMARELNMGVEIETCPTVREEDGLAMSSRNAYLTADDRRRAPQLYRALTATAEEIRAGNHNYGGLCEAATQQLTAAGMQVDYFAVRTTAALAAPPADTAPSSLILLAAATLGNTRLIDNLPLNETMRVTPT